MFLKRPNQSEATSHKGQSTKNKVQDPDTGIHLFTISGCWFPVTSLLFTVYGYRLQFRGQARVITNASDSLADDSLTIQSTALTPRYPVPVGGHKVLCSIR
jgi:hypothetical protein